MKKKKYVIEMPDIGETKVDANILIEVWSDPRFSLSQWHNEFRLIESMGKKTYAKMTISNDVANLLIEKLNLIKTPSSLFRNAATYSISKRC
jgi:hypothetical protein